MEESDIKKDQASDGCLIFILCMLVEVVIKFIVCLICSALIFHINAEYGFMEIDGTHDHIKGLAEILFVVGFSISTFIKFNVISDKK